MKKILSYLPFTIVLLCNIALLVFFTLTGHYSLIVLLVLGVFLQVITTQCIIE